MSRLSPKEFKKECDGFLPDEQFPNMCVHFSLYDSTCNFFVDNRTGYRLVCDDLQEGKDNK